MDFAVFLFVVFAVPVLFAFGIRHATAASGLFYVGVFCLCLAVIVSFAGAMMFVSTPAVVLTDTSNMTYVYSPSLPDAATLERLSGNPIPFVWNAANNQTNFHPGGAGTIYFPTATQSVTISYPDGSGLVNPAVLHMNNFAPYNHWDVEIQSEIPDGSEIASIQVAGTINSAQPTVTHNWKLYFRGGGSGGPMEEYDYTTGPSDGTVTFDNTFNGTDIRGVFRIGVEHIVKAPTTLSRFGGYGTEVDQTITFDRIDIKLVNPNAGSGSAPTNMLTFTSEISSTVIVDLSDDVIRMILVSLFMSTGLVSVLVVLGTTFRMLSRSGGGT